MALGATDLAGGLGESKVLSYEMTFEGWKQKKKSISFLRQGQGVMFKRLNEEQSGRSTETQWEGGERRFYSPIVERAWQAKLQDLDYDMPVGSHLKVRSRDWFSLPCGEGDPNQKLIFVVQMGGGEKERGVHQDLNNLPGKEPLAMGLYQSEYHQKAN